jgi:hypothetical protein
MRRWVGLPGGTPEPARTLAHLWEWHERQVGAAGSVEAAWPAIEETADTVERWADVFAGSQPATAP